MCVSESQRHGTATPPPLLIACMAPPPPSSRSKRHDSLQEHAARLTTLLTACMFFPLRDTPCIRPRSRLGVDNPQELLHLLPPLLTACMLSPLHNDPEQAQKQAKRRRPVGLDESDEGPRASDELAASLGQDTDGPGQSDGNQPVEISSDGHQPSGEVPEVIHLESPRCGISFH